MWEYMIADCLASLNTPPHGHKALVILKRFCTNGLFRFVVIYRLIYYISTKKSIFVVPFCIICKVIYHIESHKNGIQLPYKQLIEKGLRFMHYSGIVISAESIGENCTIFQGVTIGHSFLGKNPGRPRIGNRVVIFAGAKVVGNISIGDDVIIGANAVVNRSVPSGCVVVGNPAKIINQDSRKYMTDEIRPHLLGVLN